MDTIECYEFNKQVGELSPRSRCVYCEHRRAIFNEKSASRLIEVKIAIELPYNEAVKELIRLVDLPL